VRVGVRAGLRVRPYLLALAELAQVVAEALVAVEHLLLLLLVRVRVKVRARVGVGVGLRVRVRI